MVTIALIVGGIALFLLVLSLWFGSGTTDTTTYRSSGNTYKTR